MTTLPSHFPLRGHLRANHGSRGPEACQRVCRAGGGVAGKKEKAPDEAPDEEDCAGRGALSLAS
ncbi:Hypothetical protein CAP_7022 [Chondromyces apiculatus DSM 436]|uniref:Uncharacterized protein n=1 Tax=Chondromyces apiculatus DSM 436 TaxID=1192034 RepID=A0A017TGR0_9BACT|nr:Hypothetical protein CAP_7022 [Chondromyces apiculatus DSM 436]